MRKIICSGLRRRGTRGSNLRQLPKIPHLSERGQSLSGKSFWLAILRHCFWIGWCQDFYRIPRRCWLVTMMLSPWKNQDFRYRKILRDLNNSAASRRPSAIFNQPVTGEKRNEECAMKTFLQVCWLCIYMPASAMVLIVLGSPYVVLRLLSSQVSAMVYQNQLPPYFAGGRPMADYRRRDARF